MLYAFQHKVSKQLVCYQNKEFYFDDLLSSNVIHFKELLELYNLPKSKENQIIINYKPLDHYIKMK